MSLKAYMRQTFVTLLALLLPAAAHTRRRAYVPGGRRSSLVHARRTRPRPKRHDHHTYPDRPRPTLVRYEEGRRQALCDGRRARCAFDRSLADLRELRIPGRQPDPIRRRPASCYDPRPSWLAHAVRE